MNTLEGLVFDILPRIREDSVFYFPHKDDVMRSLFPAT